MNDHERKRTNKTAGRETRLSRLRKRVLRALEQGDPEGSWHRVAQLLDAADHARELADQQLELGLALLDEAGR